MNLEGHWVGWCYYPELHDFIVDSVLEMTLEECEEGISGTLTETCRIEKADGEVREQITNFRVSDQEEAEPNRKKAESGNINLTGRVYELKTETPRAKKHELPFSEDKIHCALHLQCEGEDKLVGTFANFEFKKDIQQAVFYRKGSEVHRLECNKEQEERERILRQVKAAEAERQKSQN